MGNSQCRVANIRNSDGRIILRILSKPIIPYGYWIDPKSNSGVRIYSHKTQPPLIFMRMRSFHEAVRIARRHVYFAEKNISPEEY